MRNINKIIRAYNDLGTAVDLRKYNLTLADYKSLAYLIKDLYNTGRTETLSQTCANWLGQFEELILIPTSIGFKIEVK